ncbi:AAA family ATPase [Streptomyces sp. NPDC002676]
MGAGHNGEAAGARVAPLVGRAGELARLEAVLASGGEPGTSVVDITGEASIGKSRLLSEVCRRARQRGFTVRPALGARAQAVVYCGRSPERAAACARALRAARFTGTAAATQPVLGQAFLDHAGAAAEGWVFSATYVDPARMTSAAGFVRSYERRYDVRAVPVDAAEAYDASGLVAAALSAVGTGTVDPGALMHRVRALSYRGVTRTFAFRKGPGDVDMSPGLFLWQVRKEVPVSLGQYQTVTAP